MLRVLFLSLSLLGAVLVPGPLLAETYIYRNPLMGAGPSYAYQAFSNSGDCLADLEIGEACGGIVYAGSLSGTRLYTTEADQGSFSFNNGTFNPPWTLTGASSTTDGMSNTDILAGLTDAGAPYEAAQACRALGPEWYLPSRDELSVLYYNRENIGGFLNFGLYLASAEINIYEGTYVQFGDEYFFSGSMKSTDRPVRCVRR